MVNKLDNCGDKGLDNGKDNAIKIGIELEINLLSKF